MGSRRRKKHLFPIIATFLAVTLGLCAWFWNIRGTVWRTPSAVAQSSDYSAWRLPKNCIVETLVSDSLYAYLVSSSEPPRLLNREAIRGAFPRVHIIKDECRALIDDQALATLHYYFLDGGTRAFALTDAPKTPYCKQPVIENECNQSMPRDSAMVVKIPQNIYPPTMPSSITSLASTDPIVPQHLDEQIELYATQTRSYNPSIGISSSSDDPVDPELKGFVSYAHTLPQRGLQGRGHRHRQPFQVLIDEKLETLKQNWDRKIARNQNFLFVSYEVTLGAGTSLITYVRNRASVLSEYWATGPALFAAENRLNRNTLRNRIAHDLGAEDLRPFSDLNLSPEKYEDFKLWNMLSVVTNEIIAFASHTLATSNDTNDLILAASYWWAARNAQIAMSCDSRTDELIPYVNGESENALLKNYNACKAFFRDPSVCRIYSNQLSQLRLNSDQRIPAQLLSDQSKHQSCRRLYMGSSINRLNRIVADGAHFSMNNPDWNVIMTLSSRRERALLYAMAVGVFRELMKKENYPSSDDISYLLRERLQIQLELSRKQMLTWNGFKPITESTLIALESEAIAIDQFLNRILSASSCPQAVRAAASLAVQIISR